MTETAISPTPVETTASWLYAVLPADAEPPLTDLTGVAGEPVRLVTYASVSAVVGSVPHHWLSRDPVGAATDELAQLVGDHHRVVAWFLPHAPVVPLRLGVAFQDDDRIRALLHERAEQLQTALAHVRGRAEWGLRAHLAKPDADEEPEPALEPAPNRSGTAYLLRRRQERAREQRARAAAMTAVARLETALTAVAAAVAHPRPSGAVRGESGPLLRNTTYLVDHTRFDEFHSVIQEHARAEPQLRLRLTGPWPAYSFVSLDGETP